MNLLSIENVSTEQVVLKVKDLTLAEIAMNPMFDKTMKYITVTRGKNHTLTVIKEDGTTFSFEWGESGHTLISGNLERLRLYVTNFLKKEKIFIDAKSDTVIQGTTFYNQDFKAHQLTLQTDTNQDVFLWFDTEKERADYIEELGLKYHESYPNPYVNEIHVYK